MRGLKSRQRYLEFNPIAEDTARRVEVMEDVVETLGVGVLREIDSDLTWHLQQPDGGRPGMSADQVLRMGLIKQMEGLSYRNLRLRVEDSILLRRFAGYEFACLPCASTLQSNIRRIHPDTWAQVNCALVVVAQRRGLDSGRRVRIDTTAVEALIHHPTDASLLWDSVRVLNRLLRIAQKRYPEAVAAYHDRTRASKKLARNIDQARRDDERKLLYRRLVRYTEEVAEYARKALLGLRALRLSSSEAVRRDLLAEQLRATLDLARRVVSQTRRRVFKGQKVPATEKVVSIFEPHTDIIEKGRRETVFGHKVCLTVGDSPLIFDCQIVDGNPTDATLFEPALDSFEQQYGFTPQAVATDKGFGSSANAKRARARGVKHLSFCNRHLTREAENLVAHGRTAKLLARFRAGVEGIISAAKRGVELARCVWRGQTGFCAYVWSAIVAHNLKMLVAMLV